jgi:hypothetical protein
MAPMCSILLARLVIGRMSSINIMWTVTSSTRLGGCLQQLLQLTHFHKFLVYPLPRDERVLNSGTVTSTYVHFPRRSTAPCARQQLLWWWAAAVAQLALTRRNQRKPVNVKYNMCRTWWRCVKFYYSIVQTVTNVGDGSIGAGSSTILSPRHCV